MQDLNSGDDIRGRAWSNSPARRRSSSNFWNGANRNFLSWLETFWVVASTRHFTSAAVQLGYSQAAVTVHIKALEKQLGVTLFERCQFSKNIVLTEAAVGHWNTLRGFWRLAKETKTA